jgi:hypothetical protein
MVAAGAQEACLVNDPCQVHAASGRTVTA